MPLRRIPSTPPPTEPTTIEQALDRGKDEVIFDAKGRLRQAGADPAESALLAGMKPKAEASLFYFWKYILAMNRENIVSPHLHGHFCNFLQRTPPYRKMYLMPRGHLKSTCCSEALPMHILLQPRESNLYWKGLDGSQMRILLIGEKQELMGAHLRYMQRQFEANKYIRAFWPDRVWEDPRKQAKHWNAIEMKLPVDERIGDHYADPHVRCIGIGGAITGAHPNVLIKDDLISVEAANSPVVMQTAIDYHKSSRALLSPNEDIGLEFIIGTRWAVADLYDDILKNDPSVESCVRSIIEFGDPIWPEQKTLEHIENLKREHGAMFYLLYMNSAADPELTDFHEQQLRTYWIEGEEIVFDEDGRDAVLAERARPHEPAPVVVPEIRGKKLRDVLDDLGAQRKGWMWRGG
jgi:hypothetical protein